MKKKNKYIFLGKFNNKKNKLKTLYYLKSKVLQEILDSRKKCHKP